MTDAPRLVVFDVDGTLVDSQAGILAAMDAAFGRAALPVPPREEVLGIVGLSLEVAMARLVPDLSAQDHARLAGWYREAYAGQRAREDVAMTSPLYPGAREALQALHGEPSTLLGVATGKSARGLDVLFGAHRLSSFFVTRQVADHHPSKPHPSMLRAALDETGVAPRDAVMVGDTEYDMEMARAAGVRAIGVGWGYHAPVRLRAADHVVGRFSELPRAISALWEAA